MHDSRLCEWSKGRYFPGPGLTRTLAASPLGAMMGGGKWFLTEPEFSIGEISAEI